MTRLPHLSLVAVVFLSATVAARAEEVSFKAQIAPVLAAKCAGCHGGVEAKGGYRVSSFTALNAAGDTAFAPLTAGDLDESYLYELLTTEDADSRMPKDGEPLSSEELELFKAWVEQGAKFDGPDPKAALQSYLPQLTHPAAPEAYPAPLPVTALAFSPDGQTLASSGYHEILLWNASDGQLVRRIGNVTERTFFLAFSPDGSLLVAAGGAPGVAGELRVFRVADGALVQEIGRYADTAFAVAFSPDGAKLAVAGADRAIRIYDATNWSELTTIEDHADWVTAIAFSPDGTKLASASRDKTSKVFDVATGDAVCTYPNYGEPLYAVAFTADSVQVIAAGRAGRVDYYTAASGERAADVGVSGETQRLVASGGQLFAAGPNRVQQFALADRSALRTYDSASPLYGLAFHEATGHVAAGALNGQVTIWNIADGTTVTNFLAAPGFDAQ